MKKIIKWLYFKFVYKNTDNDQVNEENRVAYLKLKQEFEELLSKNCHCGKGDACRYCK